MRVLFADLKCRTIRDSFGEKFRCMLGHFHKCSNWMEDGTHEHTLSFIFHFGKKGTKKGDLVLIMIHYCFVIVLVNCSHSVCE